MWKKFGLTGLATLLIVVLAGCSTHTPPIEEGIYSREEIREIYASKPPTASRTKNKWGEDMTNKQQGTGHKIPTKDNYLEEGMIPKACRLKNQGAAGRCLQRVSKALRDLRCPSISDVRVDRSPDCDNYPVERALQYAKLGKVLILLDEKSKKEIERLIEE